MDFKLIWTEAAVNDLKELYEFISEDDPRAARKVGSRILDHVRLLETFPEIGPIYPKYGEGDIREIRCLKFRIFYKVILKKKEISILRQDVRLLVSTEE